MEFLKECDEVFNPPRLEYYFIFVSSGRWGSACDDPGQAFLLSAVVSAFAVYIDPRLQSSPNEEYL